MPSIIFLIYYVNVFLYYGVHIVIIYLKLRYIFIITKTDTSLFMLLQIHLNQFKVPTLFTTAKITFWITLVNDYTHRSTEVRTHLIEQSVLILTLEELVLKNVSKSDNQVWSWDLEIIEDLSKLIIPNWN